MTSGNNNGSTSGTESEKNAQKTNVSIDSEITSQSTSGEPTNDADDLHKALEEAQAKAQGYWDQLLRSKAEMENIRRRTAKDIEEAHRFGLEKIIAELLPIRDSLEMGLDASTEDINSIKQGFDLTLKMFSSVMQKFGVEVVDPARGDKLNADLHQAMTAQESSELEPNAIILTVQKGYKLNGRLVRPAMVIVAKAPTSGTSAG